MLGLFRKRTPLETALAAHSAADTVIGRSPLPTRTIQEINMKTAESIAFQSLQAAEGGDDEEARLLLGDAGEFLAQIGGPLRPQSADEIYQWCAARRAGEAWTFPNGNGRP